MRVGRSATSFLVLLVVAAVAQTQTATLQQGEEELSNQRWGRAATSFRSIVRTEPNNTTAWLGLARALMGKAVGDVVEVNEQELDIISIA